MKEMFFKLPADSSHILAIRPEIPSLVRSLNDYLCHIHRARMASTFSWTRPLSNAIGSAPFTPTIMHPAKLCGEVELMYTASKAVQSSVNNGRIDKCVDAADAIHYGAAAPPNALRATVRLM
jgi:hypothetical protein